MRHSKKIRTSCPNMSATAHCANEADAAARNDQATLAVLEQRFRDPTGLRAMANHHARRCGADADDLLSDAMVRALRLPNWSHGVDSRLEGVLSSAASGINRARARRRAAGIIIVPANDETVLDRWAPVSRNAEQELEHEARRAAAAEALEELAGGDPLMTALIDGIGKGLCGSALRCELGVSELKLASLRRKLKRRAAAVRIDLDLHLTGTLKGGGNAA